MYIAISVIVVLPVKQFKKSLKRVSIPITGSSVDQFNILKLLLTINHMGSAEAISENGFANLILN